MEVKKRKSVAPFYAVAALWVVCGLAAPLYEPIHYVVLAAVSAAVFFAVNAICAGGGVIGAKAEEKKEEAKKEASTGNPELDKMLKDGRLAISEMKRLDDNIADPGISADIVRLEQISTRIFEEVRQDPKKLPQIRRFMSYYLPTTLKLLNAYDRMDCAGVAGDNISSTKERVEKMMDTLVEAYDKQFDALFGDEAMDISTDITVLENLLRQEGFASGGKTKGEDGSITLEL